MDKNKRCAVLWYVAAFGAYIASVVFFFGPARHLGALCLCLGSAMLCIGSAYMRKSK